MEPEEALWISVLSQAVRDAEMLLRKVQKKPELWGNYLFRSEVRHLKKYFRSQSMEPGGFGFICDVMGVNSTQAAQSIEDQYLRHLVPASKRSAHVAA
ncbi:MAG: hypothetical protein HQL74_09845 [Magnetococcales bacterium]|nr:hypothetical protein [Magnetococcales bacterium]